MYYNAGLSFYGASCSESGLSGMYLKNNKILEEQKFVLELKLYICENHNEQFGVTIKTLIMKRYKCSPYYLFTRVFILKIELLF